MKKRAPLPFEFVFDHLQSMQLTRRHMFGCLALYSGEKILLILREKETATDDNGVWVATTSEHHESLRQDFPSLRSIRLFETPVTGWQNLPADDPSFETDVARLCQRVIRGDPRIGKIPKKKKKKLISRKKAHSRR